MSPRKPPATPWTTLDLTRPAGHLRELAGLTLDGAAAALGMRGPTSVHTAERRERTGELCTLRVLLERAAAYGWEIEVRVRKR